MTYSAFVESIAPGACLPADLSPALQALWMDKAGDWDKAHTLCQEANNADGDWVHAYLHRKEGDTSNAQYWYTRARRPPADSTLDEEWEQIANALLDCAEKA